MFWKPGQKAPSRCALRSFLEMLHLAVNPNLISSLIKDLRLYPHPPLPTPRQPDAQNDAHFYHFPGVPTAWAAKSFLFPHGLMKAVPLHLRLSEEFPGQAPGGVRARFHLVRGLIDERRNRMLKMGTAHCPLPLPLRLSSTQKLFVEAIGKDSHHKQQANGGRSAVPTRTSTIF